MIIPPFTADGVLPHDVRASFAEIGASHLISGAGVARPSEKWGHLRRKMLLENLRQTVTEYVAEVPGILRFWIGGSFVDDIGFPTDIDVYVDLINTEEKTIRVFEETLERLPPAPLHSLSPAHLKVCHGIPMHRPLWCERHVHFWAETGLPCGVYGKPDKHCLAGKPLTISQAFRQRSITFLPKGIIELALAP